MNRTILFNNDSIRIIEQYMEDNKITFNKAVNEVIKQYNVLTLKALKQKQSNTGLLQKVFNNTEEIKNILNNNLDK